MELRDLETLIKTRRSIRRWKQKPVPEDSVLKAIELGTWAPNGGNHQNWKFVVVTNQDVIHRMADAVQSKVDLVTSWPEAAGFGETIDRWKNNADFFRNAPVCIAVLMAKYESVADQILRLRDPGDTSAQAMIEARETAKSGVQSVAAAIGYLLLALHCQGLGALWMTGPLLAKIEIEEMLHVPQELDLLALVPVGLPDEEPSQSRKPLSEVLEFRR